MRIAFVTDDGISITQHFGRAGKYLVVEIEEGKEVSRDLRSKLDLTHFREIETEHNKFKVNQEIKGSNFFSSKESIKKSVCMLKNNRKNAK